MPILGTLQLWSRNFVLFCDCPKMSTKFILILRNKTKLNCFEASMMESSEKSHTLTRKLNHNRGGLFGAEIIDIVRCPGLNCSPSCWQLFRQSAAVGEWHLAGQSRCGFCGYELRIPFRAQKCITRKVNAQHVFGWSDLPVQTLKLWTNFHLILLARYRAHLTATLLMVLLS